MLEFYEGRRMRFDDATYSLPLWHRANLAVRSSRRLLGMGRHPETPRRPCPTSRSWTNFKRIARQGACASRQARYRAMKGEDGSIAVSSSGMACSVRALGASKKTITPSPEGRYT